MNVEKVLKMIKSGPYFTAFRKGEKSLENTNPLKLLLNKTVSIILQ